MLSAGLFTNFTTCTESGGCIISAQKRLKPYDWRPNSLPRHNLMNRPLGWVLTRGLAQVMQHWFLTLCPTRDVLAIHRPELKFDRSAPSLILGEIWFAHCGGGALLEVPSSSNKL